MTTVLRLALTILSAILVFGSHPAFAQTSSRFYVGGSVGTFSVSADHVDGQSAAAGFAGGMSLSRLVDVEIEWIVPTSAFTNSTTAIGVSFAPPGSSREEIERLGVLQRFDRRREVIGNLSAVVIVHPPLTGRVTPGFIVGVSNQRARDRRTITSLSIPPGIDPQHPSVIAQEEEATRNIGGPTFGASFAIAITPRVSIVPEVRYDYGSIGDEINNALRSGVKVLWRF